MARNIFQYIKVFFERDLKLYTKTNKREHALVMFYAPLLGTSERLHRKFDKSAKSTKSLGSGDFVSFIQMKMGVQREMAKSSMAGPEAGFGGEIEILTDDNFENTIKKSIPVFVMFFASWCTNCTPAKKTFSAIAGKISQEKIYVKLAAIDAAENPKSADFANIKQIPIFKLFHEGKERATYEGDRSTDSFTQFILKYKVEKIKD